MRYAILSIIAAVFFAAGSVFSGEQPTEQEKAPPPVGGMQQRTARSVVNNINQKSKGLEEALSDK